MVGFKQFRPGGRITFHVPLLERDFLHFEEYLHDFAREAAGLGEKHKFERHVVRNILRVHIFDLGGNFRGLFEHGGNRTVLILGKVDRILDGLAGDFSSDAVGQLNLGVDGGWVGSAFRLGADFEAGEGLAFFLKDGNHIVAGAAAQANENQFHGTVASSFVTVDDDGVAAVGSPMKLVIRNPGSFGFSHLLVSSIVQNLRGDLVDCAAAESSSEDGCAIKIAGGVEDQGAERTLAIASAAESMQRCKGARGQADLKGRAPQADRGFIGHAVKIVG